MKVFEDFEKYMSTIGTDVYQEIIDKANAIVDKANIEDKVDEHRFFIHTLSSTSAMVVLKYYHEWLSEQIQK